MADILRSVNDDITVIKTSVTQAETKLETAIEAKLVDSVGKEVSKWSSCVKDLQEEVVGISIEANRAVEKKVNLIAEDLEIEKRKNNLIFLGLRRMVHCGIRM